MQNARHRQRGFTLLEVIVALTLGGLVVALAAATLASVTDNAEHLATDARRADRVGNGDRILRRLIGQMDWTQRGERPPRGDAGSLRFMTWCDVPGGWQERCEAELTIAAADDSLGGMIARLSTGEELRLIPGVRVGPLLYLGRPGVGADWRERWTDERAMPPAIGLVVPGDTLVLRVGERG